AISPASEIFGGLERRVMLRIRINLYLNVAIAVGTNRLQGTVNLQVSRRIGRAIADCGLS
ncbi:MAG: hypothetical protein ACREHD_23730, partial [Pirellulales bacterium]